MMRLSAMLAALLLAGCVTGGGKMSETTIRCVDEKGIVRVCLSSDLPDPVVEGVERKRDVRVSGIQINDAAGNEIGGFGTIEGMRAALLALDYSRHEAVKMFATETPDGSAAGLSLNEKVPFSDKTGPERNPTRIDIRVQDGLPTLVFKGKDGKDRILIGLDKDDNPVVQIIDKNGKTRSLIE
jgi:hypothetical protein